MLTSSENTVKSSAPQLKRAKLHVIAVKVTEWQYKRILKLCEIGIAKYPTDFGRQAIMDLIKEHRHLLEDKYLNPKEIKSNRNKQDKKQKRK